MPKRVYDPRTGHYKVLNEDDAAQQNGQQQSSQQDSGDQKQQAAGAPKEQTASKLEQDAAYQKLIAQKAEIQRAYEIKQQPIKQQRAKLASELSAKGSDPNLDPRIINIDSVMQKDKFDAMQRINAIDKQILARRNELKESRLKALGVPGGRIKCLLEGGMAGKMVCLNELFDTYEQFHAVFEHSGLLYATDDDGVYVVIDSYGDLLEAREILYACGLHECAVDAEFLPLMEKQTPDWFL